MRKLTKTRLFSVFLRCCPYFGDAGVQKRARGAVIPAWTRESRRHGWQTDKAAGIGSVAETLNRHSGNSRSPASFFLTPTQNLLHSLNESFVCVHQRNGDLFLHQLSTSTGENQ